jgi:UDP-N-acetyl-D-mannosaminuronic acid dehydrogenase
LKISIIGLGYVGIPLAAVLADLENQVVAIQRHSPRSGWKIDWLNKGKAPITGEEPSLDRLVSKTVSSKNLRAIANYSEIKDSEVVIIAVQTPINSKKEPDLSHLKDACFEIGRNISKGTLVCLESTVPPFTTVKIVKSIIENESNFITGIDYNLVYCYERVTPGHLIENITTLPRVVGGVTKRCSETGAEFYRKISSGEILKTDALTAEVSKLIENSHRDVNIAFANEAAQLCRGLGVDFYTVRNMINSLPTREGPSNPHRNILEPGAGVGGHCLPKDPYLLLHALSEEDIYKPRLIPIAREVNDSMPILIRGLVSEVLEEADKTISASKIGVLGLSYKENTGDPRNSPTLKLVELLDTNVKIHDPYIQDYYPFKTQSLIDTISGSDCLVIMTRHREYRDLDLRCIAAMMRTKTLVDGRNLFDPEDCIENKFIYRGLGHAY